MTRFIRLVVPALMLCSATGWAAGLELEVGGGGGATWQTFAPALTGRIGFDFYDHFTASARVITLTGLRGQGLTGNSSDVTSGYQAWAALAEFRAHTSGMFQLSVGAGLGLGQPEVAEPWSTSPSTGNSPLVPYAQASVGGRFMVLDAVWIGSDLTLVAWNIAGTPVPGQTTGAPNYGGLLTFSVGGRLDIL